jgi:hypothetical protein
MNQLVGAQGALPIGGDGQQHDNGVLRPLAQFLARIEFAHGALDDRVDDGAGLAVVRPDGLVGVRDQQRARCHQQQRREWYELLDQARLFVGVGLALFARRRPVAREKRVEQIRRLLAQRLGGGGGRLLAVQRQAGGIITRIDCDIRRNVRHDVSK